jgi:hypothetical protein
MAFHYSRIRLNMTVGEQPDSCSLEAIIDSTNQRWTGVVNGAEEKARELICSPLYQRLLRHVQGDPGCAAAALSSTQAMARVFGKHLYRGFLAEVMDPALAELAQQAPSGAAIFPRLLLDLPEHLHCLPWEVAYKPEYGHLALRGSIARVGERNATNPNVPEAPLRLLHVLQSCTDHPIPGPPGYLDKLLRPRDQKRTYKASVRIKHAENDVLSRHPGRITELLECPNSKRAFQPRRWSRWPRRGERLGAPPRPALALMLVAHGDIPSSGTTGVLVVRDLPRRGEPKAPDAGKKRSAEDLLAYVLGDDRARRLRLAVLSACFSGALWDTRGACRDGSQSWRAIVPVMKDLRRHSDMVLSMQGKVHFWTAYMVHASVLHFLKDYAGRTAPASAGHGMDHTHPELKKFDVLLSSVRNRIANPEPDHPHIPSGIEPTGETDLGLLYDPSCHAAWWLPVLYCCGDEDQPLFAPLSDTGSAPTMGEHIKNLLFNGWRSRR